MIHEKKQFCGKKHSTVCMFFRHKSKAGNAKNLVVCAQVAKIIFTFFKKFKTKTKNNFREKAMKKNCI